MGRFNDAERRYITRELDRCDALYAGGDLSGANELLTKVEHMIKTGNTGIRSAARPGWSNDSPADLALEARADRYSALNGSRYDVAFRQLLRTGAVGAALRPGARGVSANEYRDQGAGTGAAGGFLVPLGFLREIFAQEKQAAGVLNLSNVVEDEYGRTVQYPTVNDTAAVGQIQAENNVVNELDIVLAQKSITHYMYSSGMIRVSWQLDNDSAIALDSTFSTLLTERYRRILGTHLVTGTGTGQPEGILNGVSGDVTTASNSAIVYGELVSLLTSLDPAYLDPARTKAICSPSVAKALANIVDTQSRPVLQASESPLYGGAATLRLMGYPLVLDNAMPAYAPSNVLLGVGDFSRYHVVKRSTDLTKLVVLKERFAEQMQNGYMLLTRWGAAKTGITSVKWLQNHA